MSGDAELSVAGESMLAMPEKALYWPRERTLFIADVHLGKAASFRQLGLAIPMGSSESSLERLDEALLRTGASRLIVLGDLWHSKAGRTERTLKSFQEWRNRHRALCISLVTGNHDRKSGRLADELDIAQHEEGFELAPFILRHDPAPDEGGYVLAGHVHPAVTLEGQARERLRFCCFWVTPEYTVLPAFGEFTGACNVAPTPNDRVFAIADGRVIPLARSFAG